MSEIPPPTVPPATPPPPGGGSYTPPPPPPTGGGYTGGPTSPSSDRTLMIILAYLGILALIPYLTKKDDPDVHWHAKNGLGLLIFDIAVGVLFMILTMVLPDVLACGSSVLSCVVWLGILGLHIWCMIQALNGKRVRIPVVTDNAEKVL